MNLEATDFDFSFSKNKCLINILIGQKRCFTSRMVEEKCFFHILVTSSPLVIYKLSHLIKNVLITHDSYLFNKGPKNLLIHSPASTVVICNYHGSTNFHIFQ